jgi:hypothetical protein
VSSGGHQGDGEAETDFDVVLVHGKTEDGKGAQVLRARPGRLEAGEVRAVESGRPLAPGGQLVQLSPRGTPNLYDVKVEYEVPGAIAAASAPALSQGLASGAGPGRTQAKPPTAERPSGGPAQVATEAYRDSWERTFGARRGRSMAN